MRALCHYTLETGDIRRSPRSEVGDDVIRALRPMLACGTYDVPGVDEHTCRVTTAGRVLLATVFVGSAPLVTFGCAVDVAGLRALCELMHVQPGADVWAPACLVRVEPSAALVGHDSLHWLGDFERCLAWAWVER